MKRNAYKTNKKNQTDKISLKKQEKKTCAACSSVDLEAVKVHFGHCLNCPVKTLFSWTHRREETAEKYGMITSSFDSLVPCTNGLPLVPC